MRFVCDSCRAQYMISDDKVGAKGVKVRCKKCGFVISVQRPEAAAEADMERTQLVSNPLAALAAADAAGGGGGGNSDGGLFDDATEDEIGAVFDQVLSSGPHTMPAESGAGSDEDASEGGGALNSTRVLDVATVQRLADESVRADAAGEGAGGAEWYVAIDDKQVGPLDLEKVRDHWERGEIGPDSLCWRAGLADWQPLSDVPELQRHLAPRPAKPVIFAPAAATPAASSGGPVESAFAAGGNAKPASAAPAGDSGGWKPSAASALASLVREEMDALSKPPAPKEKAPEPATPGLLDVPVLQPTAAAGAAPLPSAVPVLAPAPGAAGYPAQPGYPQQPGYAPSPYGAAAPTVIVPPKAGRGLNGVLAAGALLVALVALGTVLLPRFTGEPTPAAPVVAPQPAPAPQAAVTPPPAPAVQPAPVEPPAAQPATGTVPAAGQGVAQAQPAAAPAQETRPAPVAEAPLRPATLPEARLKTEPAPAREEPARRERRAERPAREAQRQEEPAPQQAAREESRSDDPFEDIFGPPKAASKKAEPKQEKAAVYVPPAPGRSDMPETLGQSDILQVVVAHKADLQRCVQQQKAADPELGSGKVVMRWTVQTSGKVTGISCQSPEYKDTLMAKCLAGLIKGWTFPRHKQQGDPINFPFTF